MSCIACLIELETIYSTPTMIIFLSELQKQHLKLIYEHSTRVLVDFCKLAIDFLNNGSNNSKYEAAADKLDVSPSDIQHVIHAVIFLLVEACRNNLSESDFKSSLTIAGFNSEQQAVLVKLYETKKAELSESLFLLQQKDPTYQDLTWRMEIQLASKNNSKMIKPTVAMNFILKMPKNYGQGHYDTVLENSDEEDTVQVNRTIQEAKAASECQNIIKHNILQCDLPNLIHLTNKLDQALKESKSQHVRKVKRALQ